jgi:hypothetical protein
VQQEDTKNRPLPTLDQLKGQPFSEAQRLLGKPGYGHDLEYPLWEATNEFCSALFNIRPHHPLKSLCQMLEGLVKIQDLNGLRIASINPLLDPICSICDKDHGKKSGPQGFKSLTEILNACLSRRSIGC